MTYTPPLADQLFVIQHILGVENEDFAPILEAAGQVAAETFAPLYTTGDRDKARLEHGRTLTPKGFAAAYQAYVAGGWNGLAASAEYGGQELPKLLAMAVQELWQGSNIALALCPLLNQGAVELLTAHGTDAQKNHYLPKLISGDFTGTMNLTEPHAGSDVGAVRTRAVKQADGTYKIFGQKIYISYGDHDMAENIIHFVLARIDGAPEGTKGLSLFLVPKILPNGSANDVQAVSLEHKLGQHGSPTCVMAFGDSTGAYGELVGAENGGIAGMFTMMNDARLGVGIQGLGLCDRALQQATAFARTRVQGKDLSAPNGASVAIINHADVKRMLLLIKTQTEAARALAYSAAAAADVGDHKRVDFLTPLVKAYLTDLANEAASLNIQIHGGMGYIEDTGAAQVYRDARVLAIYEGTNGIQANDFVFRKILRDGGAEAQRYLAELDAVLAQLKQTPGDDAEVLAAELTTAISHCRAALDYIPTEKDINRVAAGAAATLRLFALTALGGMQARCVLAANDLLRQGPAQAKFAEAKIIGARFFARQVLPQTAACYTALRHTRATIAMRDELF